MKTNISEIIYTLPLFSRGRIWSDVAQALGSRMINAAASIAAAEAKAEEEQNKGVDNANELDTDDTITRKVQQMETEERVSTAPQEYKRTPEEWLYELDHIRGAAVDQAIAYYGDARVNFTQLLERNATPRPVSDDQVNDEADRYKAIFGKNADKDGIRRNLEEEAKSIAEYYNRHKERVLEILKAYDSIGDDFDECVDHAPHDVATVVYNAVLTSLERRLKQLDWTNPDMTPAQRRVPRRVLESEALETKGAIREIEALRMAVGKAKRRAA